MPSSLTKPQYGPHGRTASGDSRILRDDDFVTNDVLKPGQRNVIIAGYEASARIAIKGWKKSRPLAWEECHLLVCPAVASVRKISWNDQRSLQYRNRFSELVSNAGMLSSVRHDLRVATGAIQSQKLMNCSRYSVWTPVDDLRQRQCLHWNQQRSTFKRINW